MARTLDSFPEARRGIYPWDEWLDGRVRELHQGVDYQKATKSFRSAAQQAARVRKGRVRTTVIDNGAGLALQFILDPQTAE